ncbi:transcriptional regulator [Paenibacillus sp. P96]|uniref:Transcriptional regulator n=1 Tax=Paenibacillus zeirhizosphaerae TaxID=2987519 RepID=A0ABT9FSA6_9BACL|nr:transcriptional regulator [Paenibacillus sp. P96]MDP4097623.1 transcriptional regulator [Paenibacillus sp. P96]
MSDTTTIRTQLDNFMEQQGLNISRFGKIAGLNAGTMSSILNGNRIMAVNQLDRITAVLALPEGYFYEQYVQEYLNEASPNWRRIRPFLYRCAELDKLDCIRQTVDLLMDNLVYSPLLFDTAEDFFHNNKGKAAVILYECVAESEIRQHSERLALCHYRLFLLRIRENNQTRNLRAANQFEPYVDRLDEIDQLDALKELANTYRSLREWDRVEKTVNKMEQLAKVQYFEGQRIERVRRSIKKPGRPLFFYLAYSNLLRAGVSDARGDYRQALQYTYAYADLAWVKESDEDTLHWKNLFKEWAKANTYVNKLFSGELEILPHYVTYMEKKQDEMLLALFNILKAANRFNFNVDNILLKFEEHVSTYLERRHTLGVYNEKFVNEYSLYLFYELAEYYLANKTDSYGFKYLLECLKTSFIMKNESYITKCMVLFENTRNLASSDTVITYHNLMKEVFMNEKKNHTTLVSS